MTVLVVDDDSIVLDSCRRILEAEGIPVFPAASVNAALAAMESRVFDLLLVDLKMPERDGLQLITRVRESDTPVPIIVMSGYPTPEAVLASLQGGAFAFIAKPFTPDELLASVRLVVPSERQGGQETWGRHGSS